MVIKIYKLHYTQKKEATKHFEKDFFKLLIIAFSGEDIGNLRNRRRLKIDEKMMLNKVLKNNQN